MEITLSNTRFQAGVWEGVITTPTGDEPPKIVVSHLNESLPDVSVTPADGDGGHWNLQFSVPVETLGDGVHVYLISNATDGQKLGNLTIVAGEPLADDIRAEVELLRAELDMMKRAFRRHCLETTLAGSDC